MSGHWTAAREVTGERAKRAIAYGDKLARIVNGETEEGWDSLLVLIDPARFVRRGNEREQEMDWPTYRAMLDQWRGSEGQYEKTLHRATEAGPVVYLDHEECSTTAAGSKTKLRSISIYEFDEGDRIVSVDVCMGFHKQ